MYNMYNQGVNPYQPQYDRLQQLQQMQQMNNQQQMQPQMQQPQHLGVTPVGGVEEVKAFNGYFDGQPHYFIDKANNKIYIKELNLNGTPSILTYSLAVEEELKKVEYATREEVDNIKSVIDNLLKSLGGQGNE